MQKVAIIGGGPAGLSAAIAFGCEGIDAHVFAPEFGGRMGVSPAIENIPGFIEGIPGADWNKQLLAQATQFGAKLFEARVIALWKSTPTTYDIVTIVDDKVVSFRGYASVVLATGIKMDAPPTPTEAADRRLQIVAGAGDAAVQVALQHAKSGVQTLLAVRGNDLQKCSMYLRERVPQAENLTVAYNTEAQSVHGMPGVVKVSDGDGVHYYMHASLQTLIGGSPHAYGFHVELDERGFVLTDGQFHTSRPHVYAVGDIRSGSIKRVAVAAGEGLAVGHIIANVLREMKEATS